MHIDFFIYIVIWSVMLFLAFEGYAMLLKITADMRTQQQHNLKSITISLMIYISFSIAIVCILGTPDFFITAQNTYTQDTKLLTYLFLLFLFTMLFKIRHYKKLKTLGYFQNPK